MPCATRTIISHSLFHLVCLVFSIRLFPMAICLPCIICENVCNKIDASCDTSRQVTAD